MSVAHDAASESHTGTTGSVSEASFSWTHSPVGIPRGVIVFTHVANDNNSPFPADIATSVTYGGVAMTAVTSGRAATGNTGEAGDTKAWFLGASIPTGDQAVVVNRTNSAAVMYATCQTMTAASDTQIEGTPAIQQGTAAAVEQTVGTVGVQSKGYAGWYGGGSAPAAGGTNTTASISIDLGVICCGAYRETTDPGATGTKSVGASAVSDDCAQVVVAISESGAGASAPVRSKRGTMLGIW